MFCIYRLLPFFFFKTIRYIFRIRLCRKVRLSTGDRVYVRDSDSDKEPWEKGVVREIINGRIFVNPEIGEKSIWSKVKLQVVDLYTTSLLPPTSPTRRNQNYMLHFSLINITTLICLP